MQENSASEPRRIGFGSTLRTSDLQTFLVRCVSMLCRIALVHLFDEESCIGFIIFTFDYDERKLNNNKEHKYQINKVFIQK